LGRVVLEPAVYARLQYHPHIHYVVPGGALSTEDRQWHASSPGFYLPVHALAAVFRGKFRDAIERAGLLAEIPEEAFKVAWNVNCQPVGDAAPPLAYLARYVFKVAISDQLIVDVDQHRVRFSYTQVHSNRRRTMALPIEEFIRRFLQHVLPQGFMKVRHYGFLSPSFGVPFEELKARVEMAHGFAAKPVNTELDAPAPQPMLCSHCGGVLKLLRVLHPARQRSASASACTASRASPAARAALAAGP